MRHKYAVQGVVLARSPLAEAGLLMTILTDELGLIRAKAEGIRRSGAKLAGALQTLESAELMLVRGKEGWRVTGAVGYDERLRDLKASARQAAGRVASLLLRLLSGEGSDGSAYELFTEFLAHLPLLSDREIEAAETLVVLRLLAHLGVDAGELPPAGYGTDALSYAIEQRVALIARINRGISASGL